MRSQLPAPASGGGFRRALRPECGRAPASCIHLFHRIWLRRVLALRRFLERGRPHRHALRVGSGKKKMPAAPFRSRRRLIARRCLLRSHAAFCPVRAPALRSAAAAPFFDRDSTARVRTRGDRPRHLRRLFSGKVPAAAPRPALLPSPATFGSSDAPASAYLCPGKDNRHVLFRTSTPRGGGSNAHGLFFCLQPLSETVTRRPCCRGFTKRLRPSSGRNLRDMICGTQSGMRNHVPRARFTPYVQE